MKTKKEFAEKFEALKIEVANYKKEHDAASEAWRLSGYDDDDAYHAYCETEHLYKVAKRDMEYYGLLAGDAPIYANQVFYTDWEPWEVIEIKTDRCLVVRSMKAELTDKAVKALNDSFVPGGFCGHTNNGVQDWNITSDPDGKVGIIRRHKDGRFYVPGSTGSKFYIEAEPYKFYDYNF